MKYYTVGAVESESNMGSNWEVVQIVRLGGYGRGGFPKLYKTREACEQFIADNKNKTFFFVPKVVELEVQE